MTAIKTTKSRLPRVPPPDLGDRMRRALWIGVWWLLYRPSPTPFHGWRRWLLRLFGAKIGRGAHPYPLARIWAPWNLIMAEGSCLANGVECYNVAVVSLGRHALVSQRATLCTASHDMDDPAFPLLAAPIVLEAGAWVAMEAFIAPGITIHEGGVALARAVITRDIEAWSVHAGNPARKIRARCPADAPIP